ncbi:hypothetical protein [Rubrobacter indicoceani]|nr:hypothetical protein [Rubrobacter indicoceani]
MVCKGRKKAGKAEAQGLAGEGLPGGTFTISGLGNAFGFRGGLFDRGLSV